MVHYCPLSYVCMWLTARLVYACKYVDWNNLHSEVRALGQCEDDQQGEV